MQNGIQNPESLPGGLALPTVDLSIERALTLIDEPVRHNYEAMYRWFIEGTDQPAASRMFGKRLPGVDPEFAHCAQRGIHVPTQQKYAASITISATSKYAEGGLDGKTIKLTDGSWLLYYHAHDLNEDNKDSTAWMNIGLMRCFLDGVPVGVFKQGKPGGPYWRSLAFVESYDATQGIFTLHGPVTSSNSKLFTAPLGEAESFTYEATALPSLEELVEDTRTFREGRTVARKGQQRFRQDLIDAYNGSCALCGGASLPTLQGAHIIEYRGESSNCVQNGLLLRADIHLLFDGLYLSIEPDTHEIVLANSLAGTEYERLFEKDSPSRLRPPRDKALMPNDEYLNVHYERFLMKQRAS